MPSARSKLGDWGEEAAGHFLLGQGFTILDRKYRCRWGEIDLVARDGEELVFVEVRTRRNSAFGTPEESVTAAKARRLLATCQDYMQNHPEEQPHADTSWRIDLISVRPVRGKAPRIDLLRNAVEI
ncbi:MAG: YraN family protein [SAR202 cluster bacterium Io17-Chloro-G9]|nr:MAG: YraN family protein [SAR202 cluster bacterium Io17-Chloro-G9]